MTTPQSPKSSGTDNAPGDLFATTRWTVIVTAGGRSTPDAERALQELCQIYWYPLYAYVRGQGRTREDAEDLTQAFFARMLAGNEWEGLDHEKGRFRAFLLAAMKHFLANDWDKMQRLKRGGGAPHLPLDWQNADALYQLASPLELSPDRLYDRSWSVALLDQVIAQLQNEYQAAGEGKAFEQLKDFLTCETSGASYAEAETVLGLSAGAARVAVHRLRKRYRELLRHEIAQTLADPAQVEEEMKALFEALRA